MATKAKPKPVKAGDTYNTILAGRQSGNDASGISSYIYGQAAPGIAAGQLTEAQALEQAGMTPRAIQEGAANIEANTGYAFANAIGQEQTLGLQASSLGTSIGTAAKQQSTEAQQYQNQLAQLGLSGQELTSQQGYLGTEQSQSAQQYQLQQAQVANEQQQLAYQTPLQEQAQQGQAAASGASNTVGNKNAQGLIAENAATQQQSYALQGQENTVAQQQAQAGFTQQGAQLGYQQQSNTLQNQLAGLTQTSELQGYQGQQEQYANSLQQLQLGAKQAGIPAQQAYSQMQYGLSQLGISNDPTSFLTQASNAQGQVAGDFAAAQSAAAVAGGLSPQFGLGS